jgi:hypothetical protein
MIFFPVGGLERVPGHTGPVWASGRGLAGAEGAWRGAEGTRPAGYRSAWALLVTGAGGGILVG